ncbi:MULTISPECIES: glycine cleavage T C-terminal barrel domain-containing protein [unclassified Actinobaculum]|uniref:CAF17-like 4Fe-4S cluster assembly/insertion protein YgfZ n=1 Tax=unclassified Actinobaculum TaxID=2609299 RepID=UPI000D529A21|nr:MULTISPECIES: glycine cleavage T C-terminal barrel domain-containing protein [unclassified Actinobaculum]AWE43034.1 folate-binding protein YgfZ [Actinobaculum sp. 313]RTE48579.1 folate-binding protein [Actinobaculum sp. 352]
MSDIDAMASRSRVENALQSPLLSLPDAVSATGVDAGVALHYGAPIPEQRALQSGRAFTDLSHLDVVTVSGPDRLSWLHSLTSQALVDRKPGESTELLLLDPDGHIETAAAFFDDGATSWLIADGGHGAQLVCFLDSMRFMLRVEVERRDDVAVLGGFGEAIGALAARAIVTSLPLVWRDPWPRTAVGGATYGPFDAEHRAAGRECVMALVPGDELPGIARELGEVGFRPAGIAAWEAARVTAWRPRPATEIVPRVLPHELDWLRTAVHLDKGCYRGQETIAKVVNLGRPPRRLVMLYLEGPPGELPRHCDDVVAGGRVVGTVTSAVSDGEEGPVALALVRRNLPTEAVVEIGDFRAAQEVIVTPSGKSSVSPERRPGAELRRRDQL